MNLTNEQNLTEIQISTSDQYTSLLLRNAHFWHLSQLDTISTISIFTWLVGSSVIFVYYDILLWKIYFD